MSESGTRKRDQDNDDGSPEKKRRVDATSSAESEPDTPWSLDIHREFVRGIYDAGMKHCSPAVILENMTNEHKNELTTERIKSHLQKYRKRKNKTEEEFVDSYQTWIDQHVNAPFIPKSTRENLSSGERAGFLTYMTLYEQQQRNHPTQPTQQRHHPQQQQQGTILHATNHNNPTVQIPTLTLEEMQTPLGESIMLVSRLLTSMSNHVEEERARRRPPPNNGSNPT